MARFVDLDQIEFLQVDGNKEFNHGVDCCINKLLSAKPIDVVERSKINKAIAEIIEYRNSESNDFCEVEVGAINGALEILKRNIGE